VGEEQASHSNIDLARNHERRHFSGFIERDSGARTASLTMPVSSPCIALSRIGRPGVLSDHALYLLHAVPGQAAAVARTLAASQARIFGSRLIRRVAARTTSHNKALSAE
jgi:hypothetical protein